MPSSLVHLGFAGLLAAALLSDHYDGRSLLIVCGVVLLPELDTFLGLWFAGAHRAYLHNLWIVLVPAALLWWDVRWREQSFLRQRWGARGVRVAGVSLLALLFAQLLLDAFFNGINLFWPVHDAFYDLDGQVLFSTDRGFVQTFIDLANTEESVRGTTADTHYQTGVDPAPPGESDAGAEREFYLVNSGPLFVVTIAGACAAGYRLWEQRS